MHSLAKIFKMYHPKETPSVILVWMASVKFSQMHKKHVTGRLGPLNYFLQSAMVALTTVTIKSLHTICKPVYQNYHGFMCHLNDMIMMWNDVKCVVYLLPCKVDYCVPLEILN